MNTHIVHKVDLQIPASSYEKAKELQRHAENWAKNEFPDLLSRSLDAISGADEELLFIDQLELSIPNQPWTLTEQEWKEKIQTEISKAKLTKLPFEVIFQEWLFFIKNGSFQSHSIFKDKKNIENYFFKHLAELEMQSAILLTVVFTSSDKIKRLFYQFTSKFVEEILLKTFSISVEEANIVYHFFQNNLLDHSLEKKEIIQNIISILQHGEKQKRIELFNLLENKPSKKDIKKGIEELLVNQRQEIIPTSIFQDEGKEKRKIQKDDLPATGYFNCPNAGLILLLPYFLRLFENLGMLKEKQFKDEITQLKSIQIIHFLAIGVSEVEEEDLVLPKVLCGMEIDDFVSFEDPLDEPVKEECVLLLESVIKHWKALKNTSIDGLRASFLQRNGRLKIEDQHYKLEVENSGIDILLDKVPWGFRNFKLPWMEKPIVTQWY